MGNGLKMICKTYGGMTFTGPNGEREVYIWDYKQDKAVNIKEIKRLAQEAKLLKADKKLRDEEEKKKVQQQELGV